MVHSRAWAAGVEITIDKNREVLAAPTLLVYSIVVKNTGNTMLHSTNLTGTLAQAGGVPQQLNPTFESGDVDSDGAFDEGETWVYSASYQVTQDDINNGADIVNTVAFRSVETEKIATATTTIGSAKAFDISNEVNPKNLSVPGTLTYTLIIRNTGSVDFTGFPNFGSHLGQGGNSLTYTTLPTLRSNIDNGWDARLSVGEIWTGTATLYVSQDLLDNGGDIVSTESIGFDPFWRDIKSATATSTLGGADFTIINSVDKASYEKVGDVLKYTITVTSTGNKDLTGINLTDDLASDASCPKTTLASREIHGLHCELHDPAGRSRQGFSDHDRNGQHQGGRVQER